MKKKFLYILFLFPLLCSAQVDLEDGLFRHYPFNGNAQDESGNNAHGQVNNAILTSDRFGQEQSAYFFDGFQDYINLGNSFTFANNQAYTISLWFLAETLIGRNELIGKNNAGSTDAQFYCSLVGGDPVFYRYYDQNFTALISSDTIAENQWYHLVASYDGEFAQLHLNGNLVASASSLGPSPNFNRAILIGATFVNDNPAEFFDGKIDDIRIYTRAINEEEIQTIFNETITGVNIIQKLAVKVFPNPISSNVLYFESEKEIQQISIMDINGGLVFEQIFKTPTIGKQINLNQKLGSGIYTVIFHYRNKELKTERLIVY